MTKSLFIKSFGCQMNQYDARRMADILVPLGYAETDDPGAADLIILNTCHIREKATEKLFSDLGRIRIANGARAAAGRDRPLIAVAGCVAQAEGAEILSRAPFVDIVVGPQTYHRLPQMVRRAEAGARALLDTEFPAISKFDELPAATGPAEISAFLSIQEGCDKFCSFCVVPYTRGAEYSRPVAAILKEARHLIARGARELTLLGQNVNAYHGEGPGGAVWGLGRLIRALAELPGLLRLRYTTSHPRDMDDDLIAAHGEVEALMPFLHLPVQSGSDAILQAMNRKHSAADYHAIVARLREACPDIALSSDFIVGFPGESPADFEATLTLIEQIGFAQSFSFKYSARPGTPAAQRADPIPEAEQDRRLALLQERLRAQQSAFNRASLGRVVPVLIEKLGRHAGQIAGKTPHFQAVHGFGPAALIGQIVPMRMMEEHAYSLAGDLIDMTEASNMRAVSSTAFRPMGTEV